MPTVLPGNRAYRLVANSSMAMSNHHLCLPMDGWPGCVRLAAWSKTKMVFTRMVTHFTRGLAQCRATMPMNSTVLAISQTVTRPQQTLENCLVNSSKWGTQLISLTVLRVHGPWTQSICYTQSHNADSPRQRAYCMVEDVIYSSVVGVATVSTQWGMARLSWIRWLVK